MSKIRLGVNIDHVATVRNARGEDYPSPLKAALLAQKSGADSVTIHLREDRRHINDFDAKKMIKGTLMGQMVQMMRIMDRMSQTMATREDFIGRDVPH